MLTVTKTTLWAATCEDQPGGVMGRLEGLAKVGGDLEFIRARRMEREAGKGIVFVAPLRTEKEIATAMTLGFAPAQNLAAIRVEAPNEPGLAYLFSRALAVEGINLRSISGMTVRDLFVAYLTFDTQEDADRAEKRLKLPL